jgi:hypothetical protein
MIIPLALLTACGGGGGKGGSLPPTNTPQTKKIGTATFSLKLPGKNTMSRVRRPYYQSQATAGVAIDWTSTNPYAPDYSAPISAVCPGTPSLPAGVTSCTIDANGDTDYTFQLQMPAGSYSAFTVTTFDTAPSVGDFTGNELAQGQVAAPVVITAGASNTIPSLTFYGIPASVSFVPGPAQSHVIQYGGTTTSSGSGPQFAVIGNAPQTFFAQAEDADGFLISSSDSGAPTVSVAEASSDAPLHFTVATTANANQFTLTAIDASANATINASATPGGTGLPTITHTVLVAPVQELWTIQEAGSYPNGIFGYPIYIGTNPINAGPVDGYSDPSGNALCGGLSCNFQNAAIDPVSGTVFAASSTGAAPEVYAFTQGPGSTGLVAPSSAAYALSSSDTVNSIAVDWSHHGFLLYNNDGSYTLAAFDTTSSGATNVWNQVATYNGAGVQSATAIAVAPPNTPGGLAGTIWVAQNGAVTVFSPFTGSFTGGVSVTSVGQLAGTNEGIGFDSAGNLWSTDGTNVYSFNVSSGLGGITEIAQGPLVNGAFGGSFGAAAGETMWSGQLDETGYVAYTCSGCATIPSPGIGLSTNASSFSAFVTP